MTARNPGRLQDKVAIITGGASGIGRAIALAYFAEGAKVVIGDLDNVSKNPSEQESTHEIIKSKGGQSIFVKVDMLDATSVEALVSRTVVEFGRLDIMVNNAGIGPETNDPQPIWQTSNVIWNITLGVNGTGVFYGVRAAAAQMVKQEPLPGGDRGWIVNLSSIFGQVGTANSAAYVSSKHLVLGLTKAAALDCAPQRIHVNAICPGFTKSTLTAGLIGSDIGPGDERNDLKNMIEAAHPFRGTGEPEDIARAAVVLASDDARWMTGSALTVDGGYVAQ